MAETGKGGDASNLITIIPPPRQADEQGVRTAMGTRVVLRDGTEIRHVSRAVVTFGVDEIIAATLDIAIEQVENIEAHPLLSLETVRAAAKRYGFELVKADFPPDDTVVRSASLTDTSVRKLHPPAPQRHTS